MLERPNKIRLTSIRKTNAHYLYRTIRVTKKVAFRILLYFTLIELSFLFLLPFLYMLSNSVKSIEDFVDVTIQWIPSHIHWANFENAGKGIAFFRSLGNSLLIAVGASLGQLISCALAGYGFGRYRFPGSNMLFFLVLLTLIVPPQTIILSLYTLFHQLGWLNSSLPFIVPAIFAQGLRGALFVLIFRQFFRALPKEMEEAARIDGAGSLRVFFQIMLPLVKPALLLVAIFSFIWHWNDYYEPSIYISRSEFTTLPVMLDTLISEFGRDKGFILQNIDEPIIFAGCLMIVAPLFLIYIAAQRFLTEGIERTGLVE